MSGIGCKVFKKLGFLALLLFGVGSLGVTGTDDHAGHRVTIRFVQTNEIDVINNPITESSALITPVKQETGSEFCQLNWKIGKPGKVISVAIIHSDTLLACHRDRMNLMNLQGKCRMLLEKQDNHGNPSEENEVQAVFTITDRD